MALTSLYLVKVCVYLLAFYIPFILILRRTTFFKINRVYLMIGLTLSFLLPLYKGFAPVSSYVPVELPFVEPIVKQTEFVISKAIASPGYFNIGLFLFVIYLIGIAVRCVMMTRSIQRIMKLKKKALNVSSQNLQVFKTNISAPFSFFKYVFLPKTITNPGILAHEAAHVRELHWIDLLVVEIVSIILWFNPVMIFYKRSLKQQHEYLADQTAIRTGIDVTEYLMSIKRQFENTFLSPLISEFYFLSIKNRINMLTKKRTSAYGLAMYTVVLPLILCLLMAFSPRKHFQILTSAGVGEFIELPLVADINQEPSFGLPIDKKNNFSFVSGYGERMHPTLKVMRKHTGIDLTAQEGVSVVSAQDGVVTKAELKGPWGNIIIIQHDGTYSSSYSHLKSMNVKEGDRVQKGQEIGLVGHTGLSDKDHLHFEILKDGKAMDPIQYLPEIQ